MKKCFKCKVEKDLSSFYKHKQMADGYLNKCKDCAKNDSDKYYKIKITEDSFKESERKRGRIRGRKYYPKNISHQKSYEQRYPEKVIAKNLCGELKKPFDNAERHHWSYNKEHCKDVIWIDRKSHYKAHRFIVYDQERMMYRRCDTNELLDTRIKHEDFINYCIKEKED